MCKNDILFANRLQNYYFLTILQSKKSKKCTNGLKTCTFQSICAIKMLHSTGDYLISSKVYVIVMFMF